MVFAGEGKGREGRGGEGREMNEVMAEVAQLGSQETKAINLRSAVSSRCSPYLTSLKT